MDVVWMDVFLNYYYKTLTIRLDNIVAIAFQNTIGLPCQGQGKCLPYNSTANTSSTKNVISLLCNVI